MPYLHKPIVVSCPRLNLFLLSIYRLHLEEPSLTNINLLIFTFVRAGQEVYLALKPKQK